MGYWNSTKFAQTKHNFRVGAPNYYIHTQGAAGVPRGTRTPVFGVRGRCPGPLDDGDTQPFLIAECPAIKTISNQNYAFLQQATNSLRSV